MVGRKNERVRAWWFAGEHLAVGETERVSGPPRPGQHGLHAARSVLTALAYAKSPWLCRVELAGVVAENNDQLAATERTVVWCVDARDGLRATIMRWIERALSSAGDSSAGDPRESAERARERVQASEDRARNAEWVLEEGAGRREGEARSRAIGEARGAQFAVREARSAAYAHEARVALASRDMHALSRAAELAVEALSELDPNVRAGLDRELERAFDRVRAPAPASPFRIVAVPDAPDRGYELLAAIERAIAPHVGVRGVHPLVVDRALFPNVADHHVAILAVCHDASATIVRSVENSPELRRSGVEAVCVWALDAASAVELGRLDTTLGLASLRDAPPSDLRQRWIESLERAMAHPTISRADPSFLLRARMIGEPAIIAAARADDTLVLEVDTIDIEACRAASRLSRSYPRVVLRDRLERTVAAEGTTIPPVTAPLSYRRGEGLCDPSFRCTRASRPARMLAPFVSRARAWIDPRKKAHAWTSAHPPDPSPAVPPPGPREPIAPAITSLAPTALCPRCKCEYWLDADTVLDRTACGVCQNPCLIPGPGHRLNLGRPARVESEYRCPSCESIFRATMRASSAHARCSSCGRAVRPLWIATHVEETVAPAEWMDPNAQCFVCGVEYWLADARVEARCASCEGGPLRVIRDEPPPPAAESSFECPRCRRTFRAAMGRAIHVSCPQCRLAVEPIAR
jgi:hypothetical protein